MKFFVVLTVTMLPLVSPAQTYKIVIANGKPVAYRDGKLTGGTIVLAGQRVVWHYGPKAITLDSKVYGRQKYLSPKDRTYLIFSYQPYGCIHPFDGKPAELKAIVSGKDVIIRSGQTHR